jgi:hypothetical protein
LVGQLPAKTGVLHLRDTLATTGSVLDPSGGVIVGSRMGKEVLAILFLRSEEKGDAVVRPGDDKWGITSDDINEHIVTKTITEEDGVKLPGLNGIDPLLDPLTSYIGIVMVSLRQKIEVNKILRSGRHTTDLTKGDLAGNDFQKHESIPS